MVKADKVKRYESLGVAMVRCPSCKTYTGTDINKSKIECLSCEEEIIIGSSNKSLDEM